jgi:hypothetical protein
VRSIDAARAGSCWEARPQRPQSRGGYHTRPGWLAGWLADLIAPPLDGALEEVHAHFVLRGVSLVKIQLRFCQFRVVELFVVR